MSTPTQTPPALPKPKPPQWLEPQAGPKAFRTKEDMVFVWPHLVSIEAIQAIVMTFALCLMAAFVNAPLMELADSQRTPNPSKAPWYFLGLQELLLHMHPALAGVIVPTAVLLLLMVIPYVDRERKGTAIWFNGVKGIRIARFSAFYTSLWVTFLIVVDEFMLVPGKPGSHGIKAVLTETFRFPPWIGETLIPSIYMVFIPWLMVEIIKRRFENVSVRDIMVGLYTFFFVSFLILTIVGSFFRGQGMALMWPWNILPPL